MILRTGAVPSPPSDAAQAPAPAWMNKFSAATTVNDGGGATTGSTITATTTTMSTELQQQ